MKKRLATTLSEIMARGGEGEGGGGWGQIRRSAADQLRVCRAESLSCSVAGEGSWSPARRLFLTELFCCFVALVTLLVNDTATSEQRNTTVAVLGKGSSFGVCNDFFSLFVFSSHSVIREAHEGIWLAHHSFSQLEGQGFLSDCSSLAMASRYCTLCDALWRLKDNA